MGDTPNAAEQLDQFNALSKIAAPGDTEALPSMDAATALSSASAAPSAGIIAPKAQTPAPAPQAASAPTDAAGGVQGTAAAMAPGSFGAKLGQAAAKLTKSGMDPMSALVAGGLHALSTDTPAPSNTTWTQAQSGKDVSQPTSPMITDQRSKAQRVIDNIAGTIGDTAAATEGGTAGGPFAGVARTLRAGSQRQIQERENQVKMATANAQMLREQQLLHKTTEDAVNASAAIGKQSADEMMAAPNAELLASNKTSDDLQNMIKSGVIDPSRDAVFLTGRSQVGQDTNGQPIYRSVYSVVKPGQKIAPSADNIKFLNDNLPGQNFKKPDEDGKGGQEFDSHTYYMLNQRAMNFFTQKQAIMKASAETEDKVHKAMLQSGSDELRNNHWVQAAISEVPSSKDDPFLFVRAFNVLAREAATDPNVRAALPKNWEEQYAYTFGGGNPGKFEDQMKEYSKLQQKVQDAGQGIISGYINDPAKFEGKTEGILVAAQSVLKDPNATQDQKQQATQAINMAKDQARFEIEHAADKETAVSNAKTKAEETGSNGSTETGDAFLNTLPASRRSLIMGYIDGLSQWSPRLGGSKYGQSLLRDIRQYDPDWDESKAPTYFDMRKKFTTGKEAQGINAANTAMHHLDLMWNNLNTATAGKVGQLEQFLGANESGRAVANDAKAVAAELGRLYVGGVVGQKEEEDWKERLNPNQFGMTVDKLRDNVKEFIRLLGGKLESWQSQWDDGVPSDAIHFQKGFISKENADTYQRITGEPVKIHDIQNKQSAPQSQAVTSNRVNLNAPAGSIQRPADLTNATGAAPASNGKMYWHDASGKILREVKPGELPQE